MPRDAEGERREDGRVGWMSVVSDGPEDAVALRHA